MIDETGDHNDDINQKSDAQCCKIHSVTKHCLRKADILLFNLSQELVLQFHKFFNVLVCDVVFSIQKSFAFAGHFMMDEWFRLFTRKDVFDLVRELLIFTLSDVKVSEVVESLEDLLVVSDKFLVVVWQQIDQLELSDHEKEHLPVKYENDRGWPDHHEETLRYAVEFHAWSSPWAHYKENSTDNTNQEQ